MLTPEGAFCAGVVVVAVDGEPDVVGVEVGVVVVVVVVCVGVGVF